MDTTTLIAWIGAITGTSSLTWEFIKWKLSAPRLKVEVIPNTAYSNAVLANDKFAWIRITNNGQRTTTLIKSSLRHYESRRAKVCKRSNLEVDILYSEAETLPKVIDPGRQSNGLIQQTDEVKAFLKNGLFYCEMHHSLKDKPVIKRVIIKDS